MNANGEDDHESRRCRKREKKSTTAAGSASPMFDTNSSVFKLPDGWVVKEKQRSSIGTGRLSRIDRFYYEPGTNKQFRSLRAVEKYLMEMADMTGEKSNNLAEIPLKARPQKKSAEKKNKPLTFDFANPPEKINWVFTGPREDGWSPLVGQSEVSESEKQLWAEIFVLACEDRIVNVSSQ